MHWPTGSDAVPVQRALLSWVKYVEDGNPMHLREKYLKDIVSSVVKLEYSTKEWGIKAISLVGTPLSKHGIGVGKYICLGACTGLVGGLVRGLIDIYRPKAVVRVAGLPGVQLEEMEAMISGLISGLINCLIRCRIRWRGA